MQVTSKPTPTPVQIPSGERYQITYVETSRQHVVKPEDSLRKDQGTPWLPQKTLQDANYVARVVSKHYTTFYTQVRERT